MVQLEEVKEEVALDASKLTTLELLRELEALRKQTASLDAAPERLPSKEVVDDDEHENEETEEFALGEEEAKAMAHW